MPDPFKNLQAAARRRGVSLRKGERYRDLANFLIVDGRMRVIAKADTLEEVREEFRAQDRLAAREGEAMAQQFIKRHKPSIPAGIAEAFEGAAAIGEGDD
jgi:hypothetical protein